MRVAEWAFSTPSLLNAGRFRLLEIKLYIIKKYLFIYIFNLFHAVFVLLFIILDIQEFYELALQDESHSVTDEDISIAHKYIMDQFDAKVGLVNIIIIIFKLS